MAQYKMIEEVGDLILKFQKIKKTNFSEKFVKKNERLITDLNKDQLRKGLRSDNSKVGPAYAIYEYKLRYNPVDLLLHGDFYDSFYIDYDSEGFAIFATDWKTPKLTKKYGDLIFGLTENSLSLMRNDLFLFMQKEIYKILKE